MNSDVERMFAVCRKRGLGYDSATIPMSAVAECMERMHSDIENMHNLVENMRKERADREVQFNLISRQLDSYQAGAKAFGLTPPDVDRPRAFGGEAVAKISDILGEFPANDDKARILRATGALFDFNG